MAIEQLRVNVSLAGSVALICRAAAEQCAKILQQERDAGLPDRVPEAAPSPAPPQLDIPETADNSGGASEDEMPGSVYEMAEEKRPEILSALPSAVLCARICETVVDACIHLSAHIDAACRHDALLASGAAVAVLSAVGHATARPRAIRVWNACLPYLNDHAGRVVCAAASALAAAGSVCPDLISGSHVANAWAC